LILLAAGLSLNPAGTEAAPPAPDRSLTATDTGTTNLMVNPSTGRLNLGLLTGTNAAAAIANVPDLEPTTNAAPADTAAPSAADNAAASTNAPDATDADATMDANGQPQFDGTKKADVGVADLVPSASGLDALSRGDLEKKVTTLSDDLTLANTESEYFRQQWQDLRLRDEALGVDALTVDERKMEDKLVQAVKEAYQSELRRREALLLLDKLMTTTTQLLKTAPNYDPKTRADYEVARRASRDYLAGHDGSAIPLGLSLSDAQVADSNPKLNAVVLNVGKAQGVKEGMPFFVYQNNAQVGRVKIVLARDLVSAALVESLQPNVTLKVGDRVAVDAQ
jgi:hypothetical protein